MLLFCRAANVGKYVSGFSKIFSFNKKKHPPKRMLLQTIKAELEILRNSDIDPLPEVEVKTITVSSRHTGSRRVNIAGLVTDSANADIQSEVVLHVDKDRRSYANINSVAFAF